MFKKILNRLKPKYKRCSDIRYLKYLYAVNAFCGFFPFYNFDNCTLNENFYPSKIHPMLTIILRMLSSMLLVYEFRTMFYNDFNFIPQTLYIIQSIIVVLINVIPTIQLAYFNRRSVTSFIENFRKIDEMMINLNVTLTNLKYFDTFLVEILVFQVTFTLIISADYWFQSDDIYGGHGFKIVGALAFIGIQLFLYLICNFALALRARFRSLNDMIVNLRDDNRLMTAKSVQIHEFYEILIELTYTYNELFGWSILLYIAALFVSFLQCFTDLLSASQFTDYTLENLTAVLILLVRFNNFLNEPLPYHSLHISINNNKFITDNWCDTNCMRRFNKFGD